MFTVIGSPQLSLGTMELWNMGSFSRLSAMLTLQCLLLVWRTFSARVCQRILRECIMGKCPCASSMTYGVSSRMPTSAQGESWSPHDGWLSHGWMQDGQNPRRNGQLEKLVALTVHRRSETMHPFVCITMPVDTDFPLIQPMKTDHNWVWKLLKIYCTIVRSVPEHSLICIFVDDYHRGVARKKLLAIIPVPRLSCTLVSILARTVIQ